MALRIQGKLESLTLALLAVFRRIIQVLQRLDPATAVGAGILDQVVRTGKNVKKSITD